MERLVFTVVVCIMGPGSSCVVMDPLRDRSYVKVFFVMLKVRFVSVSCSAVGVLRVVSGVMVILNPG